MGRCKLGANGRCYFDATDEGADQCACVKPGEPQSPPLPTPANPPQGQEQGFAINGRHWLYRGGTHFPLFLAWLSAQDGGLSIRLDYCATVSLSLVNLGA